MKEWLYGSTIKRKLTLIIMLTCSVALLLACAAILLFEHAGTRQMLKHNTQVMANVMSWPTLSVPRFHDTALPPPLGATGEVLETNSRPELSVALIVTLVKSTWPWFFTV